MELHAIDQRCRVTQQRRQALPEHLGIGILGAVSGRGAGDEQSIHATADIGRDHFHAAAHLGRALGGFALRRTLERTDRGHVGEKRDRRKRNDREQEERDDQPCSK